MSALGEHWGFIAGAYAATLILTAGIVVWTILDARRQKAKLAALEAQGIRRRSDQGS